MTDKIDIPFVHREGQVIIRRLLMFRSYGADSLVRIRSISFHFLCIENLAVLALIISVMRSASRSMSYMAYIVNVVTGMWCDEVGICDAHMCTVCLYHFGYRFQPECRWNLWPQPISEEHRPVYKIPAYVEDPRQPKAGTYFTEWVEKIWRARAHDRS